MLRVVPKRWSYSFSVMDGTDPVAQVVDASWLGDEAVFRIQDVPYGMRRDKSSYLIESAAGVLARAERPRKAFRELFIAHGGREYSLRARSAFRREFLLFERASQIGSVSPEGLFTRKAAVTLPEEFPLPLQVFIIWLVMTLWKHTDSAALVSTAAAGATASAG